MEQTQLIARLSWPSSLSTFWENRPCYRKVQPLLGLVTSYLPARPDWSSKFSSKGHHLLKRM